MRVAGLVLSLGLLQGVGWSGLWRGLRRGGRQAARQMPFLRSSAVLLTILAIFAMLPLMLLWFRWGALDPGDMMKGLLYWHERFLPLLAVAVAGSLWSDLTGTNRVIPAAWPAPGGAWVATKAVAAAALYIPLAAAAAWWVTPAVLKAILGAEVAVLPSGLVLLRSLAPAALLFGLVSLGGAVGSSPGGVALGGLLWMVNLLDMDSILSVFLGGALDLFAWSRSPELFPWAPTRWMLLAAAALLIGAAAVHDRCACQLLVRVPGGR